MNRLEECESHKSGVYPARVNGSEEAKDLFSLTKKNNFSICVYSGGECGFRVVTILRLKIKKITVQGTVTMFLFSVRSTALVSYHNTEI